MASVHRVEFVAGALNASVTTSKKSLEPFSYEFIGWLRVSAIHAATTVSSKIQHSANGTDWLDVITFANAVGAVSTQAVVPTVPMLPYIRAVVTLAGGPPSATVDLALYHDKVK